MSQTLHDSIRRSVREHYAKVAMSTSESCCSTSCCSTDVNTGDAKATSMELGYSSSDVNDIPNGVNMGLGCGNPRSIASLQPGETVLDLGSGGGFDCFLAAKEVGPTGTVVGVDMTPDMVSKARQNADNSEFDNVEFRLGEIENLPIEDASIDVIISNCVINLSPDKSRVFQEAYRVLNSGGRMAISDVLTNAEIPIELKENKDLFNGCMVGASLVSDVEALLLQVGFENVKITPKNNSHDFIKKWAPGTNLQDYVFSAYIEAVKPSV